MKIQVLGSGCPSCHKLFELTKQAVAEMGLQTEIEYLNDIEKILEMGVMSVPVLSIDGRAVISGSVPSLDRIKDILNANIARKAAACCPPGCCGKDQDYCSDDNHCSTPSDNKPDCSCAGCC